MNAGVVRLTSQLPVKFTAKTNLPDLVYGIPGVEIEHSGARIKPARAIRSRFVFPDGSVIVNTQDGWDFEDPENKWCFAEGKCGDAAKGISKYNPQPPQPDADQGQSILDRARAVLEGQAPELQTITAADVAEIKVQGDDGSNEFGPGLPMPTDEERRQIRIAAGEPGEDNGHSNADDQLVTAGKPVPGEFNDQGDDDQPGDVDTIAEAVKAGGVPVPMTSSGKVDTDAIADRILRETGHTKPPAPTMVKD